MLVLLAGISWSCPAAHILLPGYSCCRLLASLSVCACLLTWVAFGQKQRIFQKDALKLLYREINEIRLVDG
jgi:hypothetical protein